MKILGLLLGPALMLITMFLPSGLEQEQQNLLAVIVVTVTFWVFQPLPIPVTSVLGLALCIIFNVAPASTVFGAFSSPTLFLLIGGFILTQSMSKYGLGQRIALKALLLPGVARSTYRIIIVFGALATLLSGVIDNGAVAAMLLPIALGLVKIFSSDVEEKGINVNGATPLRLSSALLLITAYGATLGALVTPFGDASNLVGWKFIQTEFDTDISVLEWMAMGGPIVITMFAFLCGIILLVNRPEIGSLPNATTRIKNQLKAMGPMDRGEVNTLIAFCFAVTFWFLPPVIGMVVGKENVIYQFASGQLPPSVVAILAAALLFMLPISREKGFTLRWRDTASMDWGPLLLVGSALALGTMMERTGLAQTLGQHIAGEIAGVGAIWVYIAAAALAISMSELTSNLVSISVLVPIIPTLAVSGGGDPKAAALIATFAAIYGFMLPISTSANAIVYSSGQIPFRRMVKTGLLVDLSGIAVVVTGVLLVVRWLNVL
ncbi:SLC13 family permease [Marinimicrobium agarilyticum]|uniref:SLC13 family permease n=1 Tax=Marinimicrobium agarilyticum TaxID=306546 RepID=UPI00146F1E1C|nr:DASS family sodium-coupled anion symporter [Marinimicrobium agarilyticum]